MKVMIAIFVVCFSLAMASDVPPVSSAVQKKPTVAQVPYSIAPKITGANGKCLGYNGEFYVMGKFFGTAQGNRRVRINGQIMPDVMVWQSNLIIVSHGYNFPAGEIVKVDIFDVQKNKVVSNVFDYFNRFCIYSVTPTSIAPNSTLTLKVKPSICSLGNIYIKVKIGESTANVASCSGNDLQVTVPQLAAGDYPLIIEKNGQVISNSIVIKIL